MHNFHRLYKHKSQVLSTIIITPSFIHRMALFHTINLNVATYRKKVNCAYQKKLQALPDISSVFEIYDYVTNLSDYKIIQFKHGFLNKGVEFVLNNKLHFFNVACLETLMITFAVEC